MKKFILVIILLTIGMAANAQLVLKKGALYDEMQFHIGEYVFEGPHIVDGEQNDYMYSIITKDNDEGKTLYEFIKTNKEKIEATYGVVIGYINAPRVSSHMNFTYYGHIMMTIYTVEEYNKMKEDEAALKKQMAKEKDNRLSSLDNLWK